MNREIKNYLDIFYQVQYSWNDDLTLLSFKIFDIVSYTKSDVICLDEIEIDTSSIEGYIKYDGSIMLAVNFVTFEKFKFRQFKELIDEIYKYAFQLKIINEI